MGLLNESKMARRGCEIDYGLSRRSTGRKKLRVLCPVTFNVRSCMYNSNSVTTMYKYPVCNCDVQDKERLKAFRKKREEWIAWLRGDDPHSIWGRINRLLWDDILFRTLNDLRRAAAEHPRQSVGFNSDVLRLLDAGFVTTQTTAIRRLTDKPKSDPKMGVISLRRLIADIQAHRDLITREVYVSYDGLPYDPEPSKAASGSGWLETTGPNAWHTAEMVQSNFDCLSEVIPPNRSRGDLIMTKWLECLDRRLRACDGIRKFVDKLEGLTQEQTAVTLDRLRACHKAIYQVAAFIFGPLLWEGSYGAVPVPQYDHLENLDKCWVASERWGYARDCWKKNLADVEAWEQESLWPEGSGEEQASTSN